jgi:hypothetical protein
MYMPRLYGELTCLLTGLAAENEEALGIDGNTDVITIL